MQHVIERQAAIAHAVRCVPLHDQVELTLELPPQHDWPDFAELEPLPPDVVRFRPRPRS